KPPGDLDVNLADGMEDTEYLAALEQGLDESLAKFEPDIIFYVAGADPYREDQLGGLRLTMEGLIARDRLVFTKARAKNIPVAVTLAGGYARRVEDTVAIHANTIRAAAEFARPAPQGAKL
ncbi:MAG TPA: histone deacetylase, partial [Terriglobia bacterium]|nr:histone deacetylase [Terriglobia bacterium]